jgi:hypothetical protein
MSRKTRRAPLQQAFNAAIDKLVEDRSRKWLAEHPPRVDFPVPQGKWIGLEAHGEVRWEVDFQMTPRPPSPIWRVPIMPTRATTLYSGRDVQDVRMDFIEMRAVPWGLAQEGTHLRWYNWEPIGSRWEKEPEADVYREVSKALAFMERIFPIVREVARYDRHGYYMGIPPEYVVAWWQETIDALNAWRGHVRVRYTIPGKDGIPEERERVQR